MKRLVLSLFVILMLCGTALAADFPAVEVYERTSKSVVLISACGETNACMVGAGFIIPGGDVVTNAHVVIDKKTASPYTKIRVYLKPESVTGDFKKDLTTKLKARAEAFDTELDLAVLKLESAAAGAVELANPDEIRVGEEVVAIGHPEQGGLWSLTYGRISGQIASQNDITGKDVFQTDTSMNRGNSGGPLLDRRGYVVGVNTNIARLAKDNLPITGVNFAVKSSVVKEWLELQGIRVAYGKEPLLNAKAKAAADERKDTAPKKTEKKEQPKAENQPTSEQPAVVQKPEASDKILTPKKPYTMKDLLAEVEKEMEDIMGEMREKIQDKVRE